MRFKASISSLTRFVFNFAMIFKLYFILFASKIYVVKLNSFKCKKDPSIGDQQYSDYLFFVFFLSFFVFNSELASVKAHDREITQQAKHAQDEVINEKRNCTVA